MTLPVKNLCLKLRDCHVTLPVKRVSKVERLSRDPSRQKLVSKVLYLVCQQGVESLCLKLRDCHVTLPVKLVSKVERLSRDPSR